MTDIFEDLEIKSTPSRLTLGDILTAMKKNGYKHIRGNWYLGSYNTPTGACILGQTGFNLMDAEYPVVYSIEDVEQILNRLPARLTYKRQLQERGTVETRTISISDLVGSSLIEMNDSPKLAIVDATGLFFYGPDNEPLGDYYSYNEIVEVFENYIKENNYSLDAVYDPEDGWRNL